jgi:hypothetical protein
MVYFPRMRPSPRGTLVPLAPRVALVALLALSCSSSSPGNLFDVDAGAGDADAGDATAPSPLTVTPSSVDFGAEDCGGVAPAPRVVTVTNAGSEALPFSVDIDERAAFAVDGARSGTLDPGASQSITLVAEPAAASTAAGAIAHGTLNVRAGGSVAAQASLASFARGGAMVAPAQLGFGTVTVGDFQELSIGITNAGNAPLTVSLAAPADPEFAALWDAFPAPVVLAPGATLAGARVRFTPASERTATTSLPILVAGVVCGGATSPVLLVAHSVLAPPPPDAGVDADADAGDDSGPGDSGPDAPLDAAPDAAADAGLDAGSDASTSDAALLDATGD